MDAAKGLDANTVRVWASPQEQAGNPKPGHAQNGRFFHIPTHSALCCRLHFRRPTAPSFSYRTSTPKPNCTGRKSALYSRDTWMSVKA